VYECRVQFHRVILIDSHKLMGTMLMDIKLPGNYDL
jgi:hypothetical protein